MLQIRSCNYDYVIDMQGLLRSALMTALSSKLSLKGEQMAESFPRFFTKMLTFL